MADRRRTLEAARTAAVLGAAGAYLLSDRPEARALSLGLWSLFVGLSLVQMKLEGRDLRPGSRSALLAVGLLVGGVLVAAWVVMGAPGLRRP